MSCDEDREDDDCDEEWSGDENEPLLGWTTAGAHGDSGIDPDRELDDADKEPFCGWTESIHQGIANSSSSGREEWSYHYGFDGSGVCVAADLLMDKVERGAARR